MPKWLWLSLKSLKLWVKLETRDQNLKVGGGLNSIFSILNEWAELYRRSAPKYESTETLPEEEDPSGEETSDDEDKEPTTSGEDPSSEEDEEATTSGGVRPS